MFNLFGHIAETGLQKTIDSHHSEISPLEWVEVLFAFPETWRTIPFDTWNAEAWTIAIAHGAITPANAPHIPWKIISKANRKRLLKHQPNLRIPDTRPRPNIDGTSRIISKNPFTRNGFYTIELDSGKIVSGCLKIHGVIASLRGDYDGDFLTCGCGEPGCSGFWEQRNHLSPPFVHWSIRQYDRLIELYFDRKVYERGALELLRPKYLAKWNGSEEYNYSYRNFSEFANDVEELLADKPHLARLWEEPL